MNIEVEKLVLVRLGIDPQQEMVVYIHEDCYICKTEGIESHRQVRVKLNDQSIIASLNVVRSSILKSNEVGLSESAWIRLGAKENDSVQLSHISPITSIKHVRAKIYGHPIDSQGYQEIVRDIVSGKYSNIHLASFITACAGNNMSQAEVVSLTKAMINTGQVLHWDYPMVMDKHSVGGIPGNRTTPIVVPIVAAAGCIIPKTSSRAITSPAGTADTVETMTPVDLNVTQIRKVIEKEGGCMVWGGSMSLSPADDIIIRVERALDLDPVGQMIASVLSKKSAVGATHIVIDVPVGSTAKVRTDDMFYKLKEFLITVGMALGLNIKVLNTDGSQPIGVGVGPALEAKDIISVLNNTATAPVDLKNKAILIAGTLLEFQQNIHPGEGEKLARTLLESGAALKKFYAICEAQGGFRAPPTAPFTHEVLASHSGTVKQIDNRNLSMVAKLAGAPHDAAAGIEFYAKLGDKVEKNQLLFRIHAQHKGALAYSLEFARSQPDIIQINREQ